MDDTTIEAQEHSHIGRRSVLAAAWSVPVVSVLAAAPAFAGSGPASGPKPLFGSEQITLSRPKKKEISFKWTLNNPAGNQTATSISVAVSMFTASTITPTPSSVNAGGSLAFSFDCEEKDASEALPSFVITVKCKFGTDTQLHTYTWTVNAVSVPVGGTKTVYLTSSATGGTYA